MELALVGMLVLIVTLAVMVGGWQAARLTGKRRKDKRHHRHPEKRLAGRWRPSGRTSKSMDFRQIIDKLPVEGRPVNRAGRVIAAATVFGTLMVTGSVAVGIAVGPGSFFVISAIVVFDIIILMVQFTIVDRVLNHISDAQEKCESCRTKVDWIKGQPCQTRRPMTPEEIQEEIERRR